MESAFFPIRYICLEFPKFCPVCEAPLFWPAWSPTLNAFLNNVRPQCQDWKAFDSDPAHLCIPHASNLLLAEVPPVFLRHLRPQGGTGVFWMLLSLRMSLKALALSEKKLSPRNHNIAGSPISNVPWSLDVGRALKLMNTRYCHQSKPKKNKCFHVKSAYCLTKSSFTFTV